MKTTLTTDLNSFDKKLHLFDGVTNGVFTFKSVLEHHKRVQSFETAVLYGMPALDGIVFLCEHPKLGVIDRRISELRKEIDLLTKTMEVSEYMVIRILDEARYRKKCRLQLLTLCRENYIKQLS